MNRKNCLFCEMSAKTSKAACPANARKCLFQLAKMMEAGDTLDLAQSLPKM